MKRTISFLISSILVFSSVFHGMAITTMAKASAITSVTIKIQVESEVGDRLPSLDIINTNDGQTTSGVSNYLSNTSNKYSIKDYDWITSENKDMTVGEAPKLKVYLVANDVDDYYFKGTYSSSNISIKGGSYVSASRKSNERIEITIKADPIKGNFAEPNDAYWRDNSLGQARWESNSKDSGAYDVYLYRGSSNVKKVENYKGTSYNFYPYMTKEGTYSFKVRSVPYTAEEKKYGKKSDWVESDEIYIGKEAVSDGRGQDNEGTTSNTNTITVGWIQDGGAWYYRYPDSSYHKNAWLRVNEQWYLFDANGKMMTGWQVRNGQYYFLNNQGAMFTGWLLDNSKWYYLNSTPGDSEGIMCKGWLQLNDKIYFMDDSGTMIQGWQKVGEDWYYFYPGQGHKAVNTHIDGFYVDGNGIWRK